MVIKIRVRMLNKSNSEEVSKIWTHHESNDGPGNSDQLTQLLHHLLVPLVLLEVFNAQEVKTSLLSFIAMQLITQHAHLQFGSAHGGQDNRAAETFVLGRIITFQANLKFNGFKKSTLLAAKHLVDGFSKSFALEFAAKEIY